jgi:hypothetical protein
MYGRVVDTERQWMRILTTYIPPNTTTGITTRFPSYTLSLLGVASHHPSQTAREIYQIPPYTQTAPAKNFVYVIPDHQLPPCAQTALTKNTTSNARETQFLLHIAPDHEPRQHVPL